MKFKTILSITLLTFSMKALAQTDSVKTDVADDEDFSQYADAAPSAGTKVYCTSKIFGLSPQKLISIGYDVQSGYKLSPGVIGNSDATDATVNATHGLRLLANFPVISNTRWLLNVGGTYSESRYNISGNLQNPLSKTLKDNGLRTMGINATLFKPLNSKYFILTQLSGDWNGDYTFDNLPSMNQLKLSVVAAVGIKKHDRSMFALGVSRTYRGGGILYIPVLLYNYTSPNRKWGCEILLPAKAFMKYNVNTRNILFAGVELEGAAYRLNTLMRQDPGLFQNIELKRSEIRAKLAYEFSVYKFIWLSVNAGYRINYRFKGDEGDNFRSFTDRSAYTIESNITNAFFANVSINLVSP
ncbi:MAG: DUF6268 family outer membrane beta-barrel protein [Cytophagales bacterium]